MDEAKNVKGVQELSEFEIRGLLASLKARLDKRPIPNSSLTFRSGDQAYFYTTRPLGLIQRGLLWIARIEYKRFEDDRPIEQNQS